VGLIRNRASIDPAKLVDEDVDLRSLLSSRRTPASGG
jgi:hypothetical protein